MNNKTNLVKFRTINADVEICMLFTTNKMIFIKAKNKVEILIFFINWKIIFEFLNGFLKTCEFQSIIISKL